MVWSPFFRYPLSNLLFLLSRKYLTQLHSTPTAPFIFTGPQLSTALLSPTRTAQATLKRLISFGLTHCVCMLNPTSLRNTVLKASLAAQHNLCSVCHVGLDQLACESDVLFMLAPGGEDTRHVVFCPR